MIAQVIQKEQAKRNDSGEWILTCKFMSSDTPMTLAEGSHKSCLEQAKNMVEFLKREHKAHNTGVEFTTSFFPTSTDVIMVHGTIHNSVRSKSRLWMTFEIKPKIDIFEYIDKLNLEDMPK